MRVGKCIDASARSSALQKVDPNSLGCYADVLDYADRTCSGKTTCDVAVPNRDLLSTRPCFTQLTMYFEAAYQCVTGESSCTCYLASNNALADTRQAQIIWVVNDSVFGSTTTQLTKALRSILILSLIHI